MSQEFSLNEKKEINRNDLISKNAKTFTRF